MMRLRSLFTLSALAAAVVPVAFGGAVTACANSDDPPGAGPQEEAGLLPTPEAGVVQDAGAEAEADAKPPRSTCNDDGWCETALPDSYAWGLRPLRITGFAMDESGGQTWATTQTYTLGDSTQTGHLLQYDQGTWRSRFGFGVTQNEPFPYTLNAVVAIAKGEFLAIGGTPQYSSPAKSIVLRIKDGVVKAEYPEVGASFMAIALTKAGVPFALDWAGGLHRGTIGSSGAYEWTVEEVPHPTDDNTFEHGPDTLFAVGDGIAVGGDISSRWGDDGLIPGFTYVDIRSQAGDGTATWASTTVAESFYVAAGASPAASSIWLAAANFVFNSTPAADGGLAWSQKTGELPVSPTAVWARSATDVWTIGAVGRIYHFDGSTWADSKQALNGAPLSTNPLFAITGLPTGEMWVGGQEVALHFQPKGSP